MSSSMATTANLAVQCPLRVAAGNRKAQGLTQTPWRGASQIPIGGIGGGNRERSHGIRIRAEAPSTEAPQRSSAPMKDNDSNDPIYQYLKKDYKWGFVSDIETESLPKGLSEETVRLISAKKKEPEWLLQFRLNAYRQWLKMTEPKWSDNAYPPINFQEYSYYSAPKQKAQKTSLDEVDPQLLETFQKLGIPLTEQKRLANVAVDAVFDSVSIATTHRKTLEAAGVIFCSISEAVHKYPELVRKYLGRVVPPADNFYAALNSAVFSDGSFCYIPKDTVSPMEISTYFRINAMETGQFERTLIVADERSYVGYLEGCTAPAYDTNQLHAAVVELYCAEGAEIKYSTVQNWYAGDEEGRGGIYNFVTKRGLCDGNNSKISWTQVETGSAITWKYPSVVLKGDNTVGEFYSVALTNNYQQADTGTKMIHVGQNSKSRIVSKGISAGKSRNCYRGLVQVQPSAHNARNFSQCDSMLIGDQAAANTYPYIQVKDPTARVEHEASTSKIGEDQLFYFQQRGIDPEKAVATIISGFCRDVFNELPLEFAAEVNQLMSLKLEGSVG
uniref:Fe-S cluster assembly protein SufB n=1 Tax=Araucaria cunninghamii TaxID=56994 RepID=A0A0D6R7X3_ARACU